MSGTQPIFEGDELLGDPTSEEGVPVAELAAAESESVADAIVASSADEEAPDSSLSPEEPPPSLPSGTPRILFAATMAGPPLPTPVAFPEAGPSSLEPVVLEAVQAEAVAADVLAADVLAAEALSAEPELQPASIGAPLPVSAAAAPVSGKKKKKKKGAEPTPLASFPSSPPASMAAPIAIDDKKLGDSSSQHKKLGDSSSQHKKLGDSSSQHKKLGESGSHRGLDDDPMAAEFFSVLPPAVTEVDTLEDLNPPPVPMSPAAIERQRKARRIVGGVVALASLVVLLVVGRALFGGRPADAQTSVSSATNAHQVTVDPPGSPPEKAPEPVATATQAPVQTAAAAATAEPASTAEAVASADAKAEEDKKAEEARKAEEAKAAEGPKTEYTVEEIKELKAKATKAINSGNNKVAVEAAKAAIAADPSDSLMHLYLGSAHLSMGQMKDAKEAFNDCVRRGKGGHVHECAAFGGRKE